MKDIINKLKAVLTGNRFKSLYWRVGGLLVVGAIGILIEPDVVESLNMPTTLVLALTFVLNEVTKHLNTSK